MSDEQPGDHFYQVGFSDAALDSILLAATEAYFLGDGTRSSASAEAVEIDGYLWGYHVDLSEEHTWIQVERFAPALSSKRSAASVEPDENAALVMDAVMRQLSPQLSFLGDVHTHPYGSLDCAQSAHGWLFSPEDLESMTDAVWELTRDRPPLWLVVAVAPLQRVRESLPRELKDGSGAWQFDVGNMRFWMHAEVVPRIEDGVAMFAENTFINLIPRLYNFAGSRLGESPHG